jgi:hypothetical protein
LRSIFGLEFFEVSLRCQRVRHSGLTTRRAFKPMPNRTYPLNAALALVAALWLSGCEQLVYKPKGTSPLAPLQLTDDGVELEVIFIRFPAGDAEMNGALWNDVDEQSLPAAARSELAANGLRAGVIRGETPAILAHRLAAAEDHSTLAAAAAKLEAEPAVRRSRLQMHHDRPGNIIASPVYDQLSPLIRDEGQLGGKTYRQAQGEFIIDVDPQPDRNVTLSLLPELQYGEARQKYVADDGIIRMESAKPKRTFDKLKLTATLAPDQMLLVTSLPERPGSLGHYFFTEPKSGRLDQKLLVIRLSDTKYNDLFVRVTSK